MKLSTATPASLREIWVERSKRFPRRPSLATVASAIVNGVYEQFEESIVLARAFFTVPYCMLPERQSKFAADIARAAGRDNELKDNTPVNTLLATRGRAPEWNDVQKSRGHVAIPLLSNEFVSSIPMISQLLKDLGLPLSWVLETEGDTEGLALGSEAGFFFVEDPKVTVDELGRNIIPAQDFVIEYSVNSVFAVGGVVFGGTVFVLLFFGCDRLKSRTVRAFLPLVNMVKGTLVSKCSMSRIFDPEEAPNGNKQESSHPPSN